jgi:hypothetical protein
MINKQVTKIKLLFAILLNKRNRLFLVPNREKPSPRSLIDTKGTTVQKGEGISKKNSEKSRNFGEIIKTQYSL